MENDPIAFGHTKALNDGESMCFQSEFDFFRGFMSFEDYLWKSRDIAPQTLFVAQPIRQGQSTHQISCSQATLPICVLIEINLTENHFRAKKRSRFCGRIKYPLIMIGRHNSLGPRKTRMDGKQTKITSQLHYSLSSKRNLTRNRFPA